MADYESVIRYLASAGATQKKHSGRSFLTHLTNTERILAQANCDLDTRLAGLCHSLYGTNAFRSALVSPAHRKDIIALLGEQAERLVFLFCSAARPKAWITACATGHIISRHDGSKLDIGIEELGQLIDIEIANLAEQGSSGPFFREILNYAREYRIPINNELSRIIGCNMQTPLTADIKINIRKKKSISIREARTSDINKLIPLIKQMHIESHYASISTERHLLTNGLKAAIQDQSQLLIIAEDANNIFGFLHATVTNNIWTNQQFARCEHLYVDHSFRGISGLRLLKLFKAWSKSKGAVAIEISDFYCESPGRLSEYFSKIGITVLGGSYGMWL